MPALLREIQANIQKFKYPPIGPIGLEITLSNKEWGVAVDAAIGGMFPTFIVDNHDNDEKLLKHLARKVGYHNISMVVQKFENSPYSVESSSIITVANVVHCSKPMVFNTLVDQVEFHKLGLVKERKHAEEVIYDPRSNIKSVFLVNGSKLFTRNGAANFVSNRREQNRLGEDPKNQIL